MNCSRRTLVGVLLAGALLRLAALPLPGTRDVIIWKIWSYAAATEGIGRMYGVGGTPPERRVLAYAGAETTVDYPPLALAALGAAGRVYGALTRGAYPNSTGLVIAVKAPVVLADAAFLLLLYLVAKRVAGDAVARTAAAAYWLNPTPLLDGAVLGYLDPLFVLPAAGAIVAAAAGGAALGGALAAIALLTKPQAVVMLPAVALAIWNGGPVRAVVRRASAAAAGAAVVLAAAVAPVVAAGGWPNMLQALSRLARHDMLSANACNLWWLVGYVVRAYHSIGGMGVWGAFSAPTKILQISRFVEIGYPNPRVIGVVLAGAAIAWGLWTARRARDVSLLCATAAFLVHAYACLSAQVHENHLYAVVPLLAIAAAGRPAFAPVFAAMSAIVALNLNLFYGISEDVGYAVPRMLTIIDASVLLSVANCVALLWHARVLRREAAQSPSRSFDSSHSTSVHHSASSPLHVSP